MNAKTESGCRTISFLSHKQMGEIRFLYFYINILNESN